MKENVIDIKALTQKVNEVKKIGSNSRETWEAIALLKSEMEKRGNNNLFLEVENGRVIGIKEMKKSIPSKKKMGQMLTGEKGMKVIDVILRQGMDNLMGKKSLTPEEELAKDLIDFFEDSSSLFYFLYFSEEIAMEKMSVNGILDGRTLPCVSR